MTKRHIHPLAVVEDGAIIGEGSTVEAYAVVKANVVLGNDVTIKSHAYIDGHTIIGNGTVVYPGASIGTKTQDKKYRGERTWVKIGERCEIREFVTINSSCGIEVDGSESAVTLGNDCLIMAYCHVAHNCSVGDGVIMSNNATLAGHVTVGDHAIISGFTPIHQFSRIGCHAMVGGMSRVTHDVPPYTVGGGIPYKFGGINLVGLKRRGFPLAVRQALSQAFRLVYRSDYSLEEAIGKIEQEVEPVPEVKHWIEFCRSSKRGLLGLNKQEQTDEDSLER